MQTREQKIEKLTQLINRFSKYIDEYKKPSYNESDLRLEFLNPFFELLDWDVRNEENSHINYKDVVVEERINVYGSENKKAPDYTFRIGGTKKFFVEAKKPSIDIKDAFEPAFQLKRYGHSAGLCLSILTDFEELSVYDTRKKPNKKDKPTKDRIFYYKYTDYIEKFDEIYNLFSKSAIKQGSFEQFEKDDKHRKGNESIDEGILDLVDAFREILAKNIVKNNEDIDVPTLNKAVIKIIDRLFFLRIAEDKEVEPYKTLFNITNQPDIYDNLKKIFKEADRRYNSELFKYFKDIDGLVIDDKILKEIIINLYSPECVYEFSQIPVSILGSMYEQFLGKTIRITDGGHVKIEEKPEVKKAGGVYYTPEYIVNYIVKNTVGEKIKDLTPKEIEKIKILDPACGSGSFLIGAYQYLIDYHIDYYTQEKHLQKSKKDKLIRETKDGYILSIQEKQRILKNNIFGVDIDQQAVEVAKFSLLLKLMESESKEIETRILSSGEIGYQGDFQEHGLGYANTIKILPNLSDNIKCGNSLIGTDYYNTVNMELFEKDDYNKINAFDWDKEFPEIFKSGGFDCVIGNPPYIRADIISDNIKNYIAKQYISAKGKYDLYYLFIERSLFLINNKGFFSFIIPNRFTTSDSGYELRNLIINNVKKIYINSLSSIRVFKKASVYPNILIVKEKDTFAEKLEVQITSVQSELYLTDNNLVLNMRDIKLLPNYIFPINCSLGILKIFFKLSKIQKLSDILMIQEGLRIPPDLENNDKGFHIVKQYQFCRYSPITTGSFITEKDLTKCVSKTSSRFINCNKDKIIFAEDALRIEAILDNSNSLCQGGVYFATLLECTINLKFLLGLLNSKLLTCIYKNLFAGMHMGGGYLRFRTNFLNQLPIVEIDFSNKVERELHDKIIELVDQMLEIQKQLHSAKTESDKQFYQKKADIIDKQIDTLVYELYGLTAEEIKIVESAN
jgi:type I restriction-modification system DNA methylase subunit